MLKLAAKARQYNAAHKLYGPHDQHRYIKTEAIQLHLIARFVESNPTELA